MITYALLICLIGFILSLIFTKWQKIADAWVADIGRLMFFAGLFVWLLANQLKALG